MTGEMGWNDLKDYPDMLALAKKIQHEAKVAAEVRPFDVYQGPYVAVNLDQAPLKGTKKDRLGLWQVKIWYCTVPGKFVFEWKGHSLPRNTPANIVRMIKELKEKRGK